MRSFAPVVVRWSRAFSAIAGTKSDSLIEVNVGRQQASRWLHSSKLKFKTPFQNLPVAPRLPRWHVGAMFSANATPIHAPHIGSAGRVSPASTAG